MAEFCRECWNKYHPKDPARNYTLSWDRDICEGCKQVRRIVLERKHSGYSPCWLLDALWQAFIFLLSLPFRIYKYIQKQKKK